MTAPLPQDDDCLVLVDIQNDFMPGGRLAVGDGDAIVPLVNRLAARFRHVVATQDWHPAGHSSFASSHPGHDPFTTIEMPYGTQTLWPDHCIQGTAGAAFHDGLALDRVELVVRKGFRADIDSYSAFTENDRATKTGLAGYLRERGFRRLFFAGLATDFCVAWSVLDARMAGFEAAILTDACRAIDLGGSLDAAMTAMREAGAEIILSDAVLS